jgi:hypothetical protein
LVTEVEVREGGGPWAPAVEAIVARPQRKEGRRVPAGRTGVPGLHISSSLGQTAMDHTALHTELGVALSPRGRRDLAAPHGPRHTGPRPGAPSDLLHEGEHGGPLLKPTLPRPPGW